MTDPAPQRPPAFFPPVWSEAAMLKLDAKPFDLVVRDDNKTTHVCVGDPATAEGWHEVRANLDTLNAPGVYRLPATAVGQHFGPTPIYQPGAWLSDGRPAPQLVSAGRHLAVSGRGYGKTAALRRWLAEATGLNYRGDRD
ncbi:hypothetical protein SEA_VIBAKI_73 [Arthrobacter phage Vibaki]|uniref:Uncharacterized protein n=1 Tax=Arthrobacter phage Vibaki TaxID=2593333 RepID=A0A514TZ31_9CAUD|nr:hypothetical protein HYP95_gp73 [Arthrobacter phage Vibaki]QDK01953.1 hypothetical protein SEA_VIBAKI_73 [Arthrobacter phage Vibaki]